MSADVTLISSLLFSTRSSYCIRVYFSFTVCSFACICCCSWYLFANVIKRYYNATCTKATSGKRFQTCLYSSAKSSCLWTGSGLLLSSGRSTLLSRQHLPLILMFLLPSAKINDFVLIILSLILFHMIVLLSLFTSLSCLCPLYLYQGRMRRLYEIT